MPDTLHFPPKKRQQLDAYLPTSQPEHETSNTSRPFVTLTYAASLDSQIALAPGALTVLSGPDSKAMTHYLRSKHHAIMVGSGTALADNPTLNSRLDEAVALGTLERQPRPVILDRRGRWVPRPELKVIAAARDGKGKSPWILTEKSSGVESASCEWIDIKGDADFPNVLTELKQRGIESVMIEGGGALINAILQEYAELVDAIIITIAPRYLGVGGVTVSPERKASDAPALQFKDVEWIPLGNDVVMCGRINP